MVEPRKELMYHKITDIGDQERMAYVRGEYYKLYEVVALNTPKGRVQSLAFTHLEDSLMRAIQAIAVEYGELQEPGV